MATVIDSLIVQLGLDPSNFNKEQKKAGENLVKFRQSAESESKKAASAANGTANAFSGLRREIASIFAIFTAGKGLKDFIQDLTKTDATIGRVATLTGNSAQSLSAWGNIVQAAGGSAQGMQASMEALGQQFQQFFATGQSSVIPYFRALQVSFVNAAGAARPMGDILLDLAAKFQTLDPARAAFYGHALGFDDATIATLIQGKAAVLGLLEEQRRLGVVSKEDTDAAQALQKQWTNLQQGSTSLGRTVMTALTPALLAILKPLQKLEEWALTHKPLVEAAFVDIAAAIGLMAAPFLAALVPMAATVVAIGAVIAAGALLYDDWKTWSAGGKSVWGDFYQYLATTWNNISGQVKAAGDDFKAFFKDILETAKDTVKLVVAVFSGSGDDIHKAWAKLFGDLSKELVDWISGIDKIAPLIQEALTKAFSGAADYFKGRFNAIWNSITGHDFSFHTDVVEANRNGQVAPNGPIAGAAPNGPIAGAPLPPAEKGDIKSDVEHFMAQGWTREQAIGIEANVLRESSGGKINALGDGGQAYGLAQWHPDRQADFKNAKSINPLGLAINDPRVTREMQLDFINYELRNGKWQGAGRALANTKDEGSAAALLSKQYEIPAATDSEAAVRASTAVGLGKALPPSVLNLTNVAPSAVTLANAATSIGTTATPSAAASGQGNSSSTSTTEVNIGTMNVNAPQAKDAPGIADAMGGALQNSLAVQANYGQH